MSSLQADADLLHGLRYPPPLATHDAVANHSSLFWDTLQKFHSFMGTRVPVIGGKELDLHVLYVEVTKRGGFHKVVSEKKWREISSIFNFSATTTSASYVLKKHYQGLLLHYEQAYFFNMEAPLPSPSEGSPVDKFSADRANGAIGKGEREESNKNNSSDSSLVTGFIDGKFDCGYLVSVTIGSDTLRGVLYFPDKPEDSKTKPQNAACNDIVPYMGGAAGHPIPCDTIFPYKTSGVGRSRRRRKRNGDPARPKPNRSGYNFYFAEEHQKLKAKCPDREREFTKMIGASWNNLSVEEKAVYQGIGLKDKERYEKEKKEYIESRKRMEGTSGSSAL